MFFRLTYLAAGIRLDFKAEEFKFKFTAPFPIDVSLRPSRPEPPNVLQDGDAVCCLDVEKEPSDAVRSMFDQLSRGELPEDYGYDGPRRLDEKGEPMKLMSQVVYMPKSFREFHDQVFYPMKGTAIRVLDVLRWRFDRRGSSFRALWSEYKFSFDGQSWHTMPSLVDPTKARMIDSFTHLVFGEYEAWAIKVELRSESVEPLAHVLFREAWDLRLRSEKGSLLIGFTAAEAGVKRHIVRMMPITKNLIMPMPSPPIRDLLYYIDDVPHNAPRLGNGPLIPKSIRKALSEMGTLRNKITHTGEHDPEGPQLTMDFLDETLGAVRDLLWLLDYYAGHLWAKEYVSRERLKELSESRK